MLIKVKGGHVWKMVCDEIDLYGWLIKDTEVVLGIQVKSRSIDDE